MAEAILIGLKETTYCGDLLSRSGVEKRHKRASYKGKEGKTVMAGVRYFG